MKAFLILKCGYHDAANFIRQITESQIIDRVLVFRDTECGENSKINYVLGKFIGIRSLKIVFRFFQLILNAKFRPNVLIGIYEIPHGLLAVLISLLIRRPSIVSIIGNPGYTKIRKGFRLKITLYLLRLSTFITVTGTNSKKILENMGINPHKIFVLPNTMSFEDFKEFDIEKEYDIISLGRLSEEKRLDILINVVEKLRVDIPNIKVAIAGVGPEKDNISHMINMKNLSNNIVLLGFVEDDDLVTYFNKGKVFVLTSETEGFPRTIVQAASCGTPVVSSEVGDITDILVNEINALTVANFDDIDKYVDAIRRLLREKEFARKIAGELNACVRQKFSVTEAEKVWSIMFSKLN